MDLFHGYFFGYFFFLSFLAIFLFFSFFLNLLSTTYFFLLPYTHIFITILTLASINNQQTTNKLYNMAEEEVSMDCCMPCVWACNDLRFD